MSLQSRKLKRLELDLLKIVKNEKLSKNEKLELSNQLILQAEESEIMDNPHRLIASVIKGDLDKVKDYIRDGVAIDTVSLLTQPLIHIAALLGHSELIEYFVQKGINPNLENNDGYSPIHLAIINGHIDIVRILIENAGISPEHRESKNLKATLMHFAAIYGRDDIIQFLVEKSANLNLLDNSGKTPLHYAAMKGNNSTIELLLNTSLINIDQEDYTGHVALHKAAKFGHFDTIKLLIKKGAYTDDHILSTIKTLLNTYLQDFVLFGDSDDDSEFYAEGRSALEVDIDDDSAIEDRILDELRATERTEGEEMSDTRDDAIFVPSGILSELSHEDTTSGESEREESESVDSTENSRILNQVVEQAQSVSEEDESDQDDEDYTPPTSEHNSYDSDENNSVIMEGNELNHLSDFEYQTDEEGEEQKSAGDGDFTNSDASFGLPEDYIIEPLGNIA